MTAFMPHGMCYLWKPWLVGLHLVSSGVIALSYFSIPVTLLYILRKREDIPFNSIFLLFAAFILCCGVGHAFDIWTLWHPNYWVSGGIRLVTGLVSLTTAIALGLKIPQILTLPSPAQVNEIDQQLHENIAELEEQKRFLRIIYDNVQEAIFVLDVKSDREFYYQGFNPAAHRLTGIKEVIGKTPAQILSAEIATAVTQRYQKCLESQATISYEECLPFRNRNNWWLTTLNPIADENGHIYRIVGTSLNISDRKEVETELDREKHFLQALLDNLSDGIVACDRDGVLTLFNQATKEFHGLPETAIPASEWAAYYDLYLPDGETMMSREEIPLFRALQGESVRDVEMMIIPKQGKTRTLLANGDPILDRHGEKIGAIVAMRDISDRKMVEQALARLNYELEIRVQERTTQLEQVNKLLFGVTEQLRKSNQELEQFAYIASHDLKAPLRAISNLSEWIEEDLADKLDEESRNNLDLLRGRVHRLENLINGLLAYSRVGKATSKTESVNVAIMLAEIIDLLDVPHNFQIEIQGAMPTFITEVIPLQQVFSNLISNAIKHSNSNEGKITVSAEEQEDYYLFTVADNGKGIDPQYHDRIFTIFQTLEARDTKESTGIGLAIVKKVVENQGGTIEVQSQLGAGTQFHFTWRKT
jgi:PAS domain S-box-containing protein